MAEGIHLLLKVFVIIGAVLAVLPLLFLVSGVFMGETELGQLLFSGTDGGAGYTAWHMIPLIRHFKISWSCCLTLRNTMCFSGTR